MKSSTLYRWLEWTFQPQTCTEVFPVIGLQEDNTEEITRVYTATFASPEVFEQLERLDANTCMLFTHHPKPQRLNTSDFLRSVLNQEVGLRTGSKLSVLTCYEVPGQKKLFFLTDGGMVVAPDVNDKAAIVTNAVEVLHNMGIAEPKVAILSSNEKVSEKIPSTVDAQALCQMSEEGKLPKAIYEGPIAFDVAMRPDAAKEKKIESRVTGDVDLFLVPNIETGNCLGKAIGYFGGGDTAGLVIGARKPVVMSSRAASIRGKLASVAWALLACGEN